MASFLDKAKEKLTGNTSSSQPTSSAGSQQSEPTVSIQPHPAVRAPDLQRRRALMSSRFQRTNDPRDLQDGPQYGGLNANPDVQAFHARGPYIPNQELLNKVDKPLVRGSRSSGRPSGAEFALQSRDELNARAAELNKQDVNDVVNPGSDASGI